MKKLLMAVIMAMVFGAFGQGALIRCGEYYLQRKAFDGWAFKDVQIVTNANIVSSNVVCITQVDDRRFTNILSSEMIGIIETRDVVTTNHSEVFVSFAAGFSNWITIMALNCTNYPATNNNLKRGESESRRWLTQPTSEAIMSQKP